MLQGARRAIRSFRHDPGLIAAAFVLLVLGVGLNTAVFTFVNAAMIRPLPYPGADRLVTLWEIKRERTTGVGAPLTAANFADVKARSRSFQSISAARDYSVEIGGEGLEPERSTADGVLEDYFETLGVSPLLGRAFESADYREAPLAYRFPGPPDGRIVAGLADRAIISYSLWQRRLGGDRSVIGKRLELDGGTVTIVGVMPPRFQPVSHQERVALWMPYVINRDGLQNRELHQLWTVARLRAGASAAEATKEIADLYQGLAAEHPVTNEGWSAQLVPLESAVLGATETLLPLLLAGAGLVLLIACANVASLLLTRATRRREEIRTRVALGASTPRLLRQLATEALLLALAAGGASLGVAWGAARLFQNLRLAQELPFFFEPRLDAGVLAFALTASMLASLIFGLAPAVHIMELGRRAFDHRTRPASANRMGAILVTSQIALTVMLLVMGGLLLQSLHNLNRVELGFRAEGLLALRVTLPASRYPAGEPVRRFHQRLLESISTLPGVSGAASGGVAFARDGRNFPFTIEGRPSSRDTHNAEGAVVSEDFFSVLGIPLLAGRGFETFDGPGAPWVAVINETLAAQYWPGEDPIGRRIRISGAPRSSTVVGIVGDARIEERGLRSRQIYLPHRQIPERDLTVHVRTAGPPLDVAATIRGRVRELDPRLPIFDVREVSSAVESSVAPARFRARLVGFYGLVAVAIAIGGLFGLVSFSVARRTQEIGLRMALGAGPKQIIVPFVRRGLGLALGGIVAGTAAALLSSRLAASFLFEVDPADPLTFVSVSALVLLAAGAASYWPARRAAETDPSIALRHR